MGRSFVGMCAIAASGLTLFIQPVKTASPAWGIVTQAFGDQHRDKVAELRAGSVRIDFNWYEMEAVDDGFNFLPQQEMVERASDLGLEVYATLAYSPMWAAPVCGEPVEAGKPPSAHCRPYDLNEWKEFVTEVINHFGWRNNITFGIWNEPNLHFLNDNNIAALWGGLWQYATFGRADSQYPSVRFGGPETSWHALGNGYYAQAIFQMQQWWVPQDVVTVHWYPHGTSVSSFMSQSYQQPQREIWLTETDGDATCDENSQSSVVNNIASSFQYSGFPQWTRTFLYVLHTNNNCDHSIVRPDWSNRPAFVTYQNWMP